MNTQPPHGNAADQQIHNIGTTARFIQMIVLMLLASSAMTASLMNTVDSDSMGCLLAAGANLDEPSINGIALATTSQPDAYQDCLDEYTSTPPAWIGPLGVLLTAAAALVLFLAIPKWRTRRGRVVVLSEQDQVIRAQVQQLSYRAGLPKTPTIVIDLVEPRIGAVSFGRNGNPVIRINGAAIRERESQPKLFEALLLHEFAHVRNRDITLTYASVALWRVFVLFAVIPYLVFEIMDLPNAAAGFASETAVQLNLASQGLAVVLVGMTYLARLEVLRRREYDADQAAIGWGADPRALEKLADHTSNYQVIRWLSPLWQTHPRPDSRKAAVDDPSTLVSLRPLWLIFTGAAAILITDHVPEDVLSTIGLPRDWTDLVSAAIAAALVTAVVGTSLWRAVIYASFNRKTAPTGVLAGLWLGSGMVLGQLASFDVSFRIDWLPDYPWVYLVLVAIAIAYTWWGSQTARVWVERWPGRRIAPIMLLNLIGAGLLLAVALGWWTSLGITFSSRSMLDVIALNRFATEGLLSDSTGPYEQALTLISTLTPFWVTLILAPLAWLAVTVLLLLSLTAWAIPPGAHDRPWTARFGGKPRAQPVDLLPLRGVLLTALLGGAVALVGILFVKSLMEPSAVRLGGNPDGFLDIMIFAAGSEAAIAAGTLVAAIVVSAITGRYRLLTAVATAALAAWAGLAAAFLVNLTEGCHGPLNLFRSTCSLNPEAAMLLARADVTLSLAIAPIAAFIGAGLVSGVHRLLRIPTRRWVREWSSSRPVAGQTVRTWGVLIVCAPLAGLGIVAETATWSGSDSGSSSTELAELIAEDDSILSPETQAFQIYAWHHYGGLDLVDRLSATLLDYAEFWTAVGEEAENNPEGYVDVDIDQVEAMCDDLTAEVDDAQRYFTIPDAAAQELWTETIDLIDAGARTCLQAVEDRDQYLFVEATTLITSAVPYLEEAVARLDEFDRPDWSR